MTSFLAFVVTAFAAGAIGYVTCSIETRMQLGELHDQLRAANDRYKDLSRRVRRLPVGLLGESHTEPTSDQWGDPDPHDPTFIPADSPDDAPPEPTASIDHLGQQRAENVESADVRPARRLDSGPPDVTWNPIGEPALEPLPDEEEAWLDRPDGSRLPPTASTRALREVFSTFAGDPILGGAA